MSESRDRKALRGLYAEYLRFRGQCFPLPHDKGNPAMVDAHTALALPDPAAELAEALRAAIARVEIANAEGNPILSAWLPSAREAINAWETQ